MTGSTQFNATIDALVRKGFEVERITPAREETGDGNTAYLNRRHSMGMTVAMVEEISPHDIMVNGETLSVYLDSLD